MPRGKKNPIPAVEMPAEKPPRASAAAAATEPNRTFEHSVDTGGWRERNQKPIDMAAMADKLASDKQSDLVQKLAADNARANALLSMAYGVIVGIAAGDEESPLHRIANKIERHLEGRREAHGVIVEHMKDDGKPGDTLMRILDRTLSQMARAS